MPRTRFDKYKKRDLILETIQGRVVCGEVPCEDIADCLGLSPRQTYRRRKLSIYRAGAELKRKERDEYWR